MKKVLSIFILLFAANLNAFAAITPEQVMSEEYIYHHGHSKEMARLMDLQSAQINGQETAFVTKVPEYYSRQPYKFVRSVFIYFDPGMDDGLFMQHDTKFTNRYDCL